MASSSLIITKAKTSSKNIFKVLARPGYLVLAIILGLFILGFVLWSLNIDLLGYIIFQTDLSFLDKFTFFTSVYGGIFTSAESAQALSMIVFSILFGINSAVVVFVLRNRKNEKALHGSTVAGISLAVVGGGCIACGTSILAPVLISIGATGSVTFLNEIGVLLNTVASIFLMWSLYRLGLSVGTIIATNK